MADPASRAGSRYGNEALLNYVAELHAQHDTALNTAFDAPDVHGMPAIQVSQSEGRLLTLLLKLIGAKRVVEIGTLAGYSCLRMLEALPSDGHVWTIEFDEKHAEVATEVFNQAGVLDRVTVCQGPALDWLPKLTSHGPFDAVFIDADKGNYDHYGRWATEHLRPGGLLLGDNAHLFGELLDDSERAHAMRRFHEEAVVHFDTTCVPTPDGILIGIKR